VPRPMPRLPPVTSTVFCVCSGFFLTGEKSILKGRSRAR